MKILYVCQYFPPEGCAPAARAADLSREWVRAGHQVTVLTGFPNHPEGIIHPAYRRAAQKGFLREEVAGAKVFRTWLFSAANRGILGRSANYFSFAVSAAASGAWVARGHDVVIGTSPQLLAAAAAYAVARFRALPFVFEVRDLWPESLEAVGVANRDSILYSCLARLAQFLYGRADRIVVDGHAKRAALAESGVPGQKTAVIRNGVAEDFCPDPASQPARAAREMVRAEFGLGGKFVVAYCGTLGMAHALSTVLDAAERLRTRSDVVFLIAGEGAEQEKLTGRIRQSGLANVLYIGKQPRDVVPALLAAADACLVSLRQSEVFKTAIPSKMFEIMAAGRPVILAAPGEADELLAAANAGIAVPPQDPDALTAAILRLRDHPDACLKLGANGRRAVLENYTRRRQASAYLELLEEILFNRARRAQAAFHPPVEQVAMGRARQMRVVPK